MNENLEEDRLYTRPPLERVGSSWKHLEVFGYPPACAVEDGVIRIAIFVL